MALHEHPEGVAITVPCPFHGGGIAIIAIVHPAVSLDRMGRKLLVMIYGTDWRGKKNGLASLNRDPPARQARKGTAHLSESAASRVGGEEAMEGYRTPAAGFAYRTPHRHRLVTRLTRKTL